MLVHTQVVNFDMLAVAMVLKFLFLHGLGVEPHIAERVLERPEPALVAHMKLADIDFRARNIVHGEDMLV